MAYANAGLSIDAISVWSRSSKQAGSGYDADNTKISDKFRLFDSKISLDLSNVEPEIEPCGSSESDRFQGGLLTARSSNAWPRVWATKQLRLSFNLSAGTAIPSFGGCPDWIKPLIYQEYQVHNKTFSN